jgi:hypothetical protein
LHPWRFLQCHFSNACHRQVVSSHGTPDGKKARRVLLYPTLAKSGLDPDFLFRSVALPLWRPATVAFGGAAGEDELAGMALKNRHGCEARRAGRQTQPSPEGLGSIPKMI